MEPLILSNLKFTSLEVVILTCLGFGALELIPLTINIWAACGQAGLAIVLGLVLLIVYLITAFGISRRNYIILEVVAGFMIFVFVVDFLDTFVMGVYEDTAKKDDHHQSCDCILSSKDGIDAFALFDLLTTLILAVMVIVQAQRYRKVVRQMINAEQMP